MCRKERSWVMLVLLCHLSPRPQLSPLYTWQKVMPQDYVQWSWKGSLKLTPFYASCSHSVISVLQLRNVLLNYWRERGTESILICCFVFSEKVLHAMEFKLAIPVVKQLWAKKNITEKIEVLIWMFAWKTEKLLWKLYTGHLKPVTIPGKGTEH